MRKLTQEQVLDYIDGLEKMNQNEIKMIAINTVMGDVYVTSQKNDVDETDIQGEYILFVQEYSDENILTCSYYLSVEYFKNNFSLNIWFQQ